MLRVMVLVFLIQLANSSRDSFSRGTNNSLKPAETITTNSRAEPTVLYYNVSRQQQQLTYVWHEIWRFRLRLGGSSKSKASTIHTLYSRSAMALDS